MKRVIIFALLLPILSVPAFAADLQVLDLQYTAAGRLVANIFNQAPDGVDDDILVKFYDNGNEIGSQLYTDALPRYSVFSVYIDYKPSPGAHEFKAAADPENAIKESNDGNNGKTISFEQSLDTAPRNATPEPRKEETATEEGGQEEENVPPALQINSGEVTMTLLAVVAVLAVLLAIRMLHIRGRMRMTETKGKEEQKPAPSGRKELDAMAAGKPVQGGKWKLFRRKEAPKDKNPALAKPPEGGKGRFGIFGRKEDESTRPLKPDGHASVKQAIAMKPGTAARLDASLTFNGKVGDDYTYFVKDESGEAVGISKEKLPEGEHMLDCIVESFMKDDKVLRIRAAG